MILNVRFKVTPSRQAAMPVTLKLQINCVLNVAFIKAKVII